MGRDILLPPDLPAVLRDLDVRVGRVSDDEVWALCPAHYQRVGKEDTSPTNFSINVDTGLCYCFSCGYSDSLGSMLARWYFGNDAWATAQFLRGHGATLIDALQRIDRKVKRSHVMAGIEDGSDPEFEFVTFDDVPEMMLVERNLARESVDFYNVRWDEKKAHWIVPFVGTNGRVSGWQRKWPGKFDNEPTHLRKRNFLFGLNAFVPGSRAILVESPLDVCRLHTAGYEGGLATYGVEISDEQRRLILENARSLVLALDNDAAGERMTRELCGEFSGRLPLRVFRYSRRWKNAKGESAKDPGELTDDQIDAGFDEAYSPLLGGLL